VDLLLLLTVVFGIAVATLFNYYLNLAPGSEPKDFQVGPNELGITCDCYLNMLILSGIVVLALSLTSYMFDSPTEVIILGAVGFILVTLAGYFGRRKRYRGWEEMEDMLDRVIPKSRIRRPVDDPVDLYFEDDDY